MEKQSKSAGPATGTPRTHYDVLDVPLGVDPEALRAAYLKLARRYHPDRNPLGAARMAEVNVAYAVLSDPAERKRYDVLIHAEKQKCPRCRGSGFVKLTRGFGRKVERICSDCGGSGDARA